MTSNGRYILLLTHVDNIIITDNIINIVNVNI